MKCNGINFSTMYTRGSQKSRNRIIHKMSDNIYVGVIKKYSTSSPDKKFISIKEIKDIFRKILPEPLHLNIKKLIKKNPDADGSIYTLCSDKGIYGYKINIPVKNNLMHIKNIPILMHETTHLLDFAVNTKHNAVFGKFVNNPMFDKVVELYEKFYYTIEDFSRFRIKYETKKLLKDMTNEDKLLALKYLKLNVETEKNAYDATIFYAERLRMLRRDIRGYDGLKSSDFNFRTKIKLLDKMRYKIIKQERNKIRKNAVV